MGTNYDDFVANDESVNNPEVDALSDVFGTRYRIAMQFIALRERRG